MKKRLSIILCVVMMLTIIPTTVFAKTVKAKSVSIAPKSMTLAVDDIAQLSATMKPNNATSKLSWYSSDEDVATVSNKGLVQGKARGTATITVETANGKTATCSIKVKEYAEKTAESTPINTTGDIFATIKDRIITLIKSLTYTKSEIDSLIANTSDDDDYLSASKLKINDNQPASFTSKGKTFTITSVEVTKEPYNKKNYEERYNNEFFYRYQYHMTVKGTTEVDSFSGCLYMYNKYGADDTIGIDSSNSIIDDSGEFVCETTKFSQVNCSEACVTWMQWENAVGQ